MSLTSSHSARRDTSRTLLPMSCAAKLSICCGRAFICMALLSPMLLPSAPVPVQTTNADAVQPTPRMTPRYKRPSLEGQVEVLARYLDLNEDQRSTLRNILMQRQKEILQMRLTPTSAGSPSDRFRAIEDQTAERIRAALNEEQRKKYDPIGARSLTPAPPQSSVEDWLKTTGPR